MLGSECVSWLRDGYWTPITFGSFIPKSPNFQWEQARGAERIFYSFLSQDAPLWIFLIGGILFFRKLNKRMGFY
jgi:hypothetical protein